MANVDFFKQQSKNLLKDYNSRVFNEEKGTYEYSPRYFPDVGSITLPFTIIKEGSFTLMNAQHIVAQFSGFKKWNDLIKASEPMLEIGKLLLTHRLEYQKKQGYLEDMITSVIADDWETYVDHFLKGCDDDTKLEVFKKEFLKLDDSKEIIPRKLTIDFSDNVIAQDMVNTIMKEKNYTPEKAVLASITSTNLVAIIDEGWADLAVSLWGHDDPYKKFEKLENPIIEITPNKEHIRMLDCVMGIEKVSLSDAITYFMIFQLENYGYHI